ncbi:hypothetical protein SAMN05421835_102371 [Amycolatopsis sacchari]|uniref:Uncharacterized protein n=1 Tax=Amycolatopsis sacchari TaxID=115433 RepID=A0A1I3MKX1_9PSEU|nr:hypothetical protein [Amycolatopsis sacchari]SFI97365.1 hypothetical protein SAMN05421835_102371 [Amycolatopsis sacchari]
MSERDQALTTLRRRGVLDALVWAQRSAYGQVRQDYNPEGGHKQSWIGFSGHTYLIDRLDRVFQCGDYAAPRGEGPIGRDVLAAGITDEDFRTMPHLPAGTVVRHDFNGSPGWSADGWRWLLTSYRFGEVHRIRWPEHRKTKQLVARQPHDDGGLFPLTTLTTVPVQPTLILAHAMDPETVESELFLGRSRWNPDGGDAWVWCEDLLAQPPARTTWSEPHLPIAAADPTVPDADVALRRAVGGPRAIGDA